MPSRFPFLVTRCRGVGKPFSVSICAPTANAYRKWERIFLPPGKPMFLPPGKWVFLPPPLNPLKSLAPNFAPSNDLQEGKKSTPVRTGALVRKLATGRAGVEFLNYAGDVGACPSDSANLEPLLAKSDLAKSGTLTGWGGSGREGKVSHKPDRQRPWQRPDLPRMDRGRTRGQFPASGGRLIQMAQKVLPLSCSTTCPPAPPQKMPG